MVFLQPKHVAAFFRRPVTEIGASFIHRGIMGMNSPSHNRGLRCRRFVSWGFSSITAGRFKTERTICPRSGRPQPGPSQRAYSVLTAKTRSARNSIQSFLFLLRVLCVFV